MKILVSVVLALVTSYYIFCIVKFLGHYSNLTQRISNIKWARAHVATVIFVITMLIVAVAEIVFGLRLKDDPISSDWYIAGLIALPVFFVLGYLSDSYIIPKTFICPSCPQAIFFISDWKCQACGFLNKQKYITAKCKKCGNKLTAINCPNCKKKIEYSEVSDEKK